MIKGYKDFYYNVTDSTSSFQVIGFVNQDRSGRVRWLLQELGIPYSSRFLDWKSGESESAEYLSLNPLGVVPTLIMDGKPFIESGAICMYLGDRYGVAKGLVPDSTSFARAEYLQWFFMATSELDAKINELGLAENSPEGDPQRARIPGIVCELREIAQIFEARLKERDYLVGNEFSVADIIAGSCLAWHLKEELPLADFPAIHAYVARLKERPSVKATGAIKP